jgi:putative heme-binding domain-containing protein
LTSKATSPETLIVALRKLQSVSWRDSFNNNHPKLNLKLLRNLLDAESKNVVREVIQTIRGIGNSESKTLIREIANDRKKFGENTIEAIIGLDPVNEVDRKLLLELCMEDSKLGQTAVQSMLNSDLSSTERESIQRSALPSAARLLKVEKLRSKTFELTSTVQSKLASADADAGRRIFFNSRFGQCAKCHQVDGRGGNVGPDLSNISNMALGRLLESIVEPSKEIAPRHTPILIETYDGKSFSGVLYAERGEEITYADSNGKLIKVRFDDIERSKPQTKSIMPEGLLERMTVDEVADLAKYLLKR